MNSMPEQNPDAIDPQGMVSVQTIRNEEHPLDQKRKPENQKGVFYAAYACHAAHAAA